MLFEQLKLFKFSTNGTINLTHLNNVPRRTIKNYVRPYRMALYNRKKVEERKNPVTKPPNPRNTYLEWNYNAELFAFGKRLNEAFDDTLLRQALTDKTFAVKERLRLEELGLGEELKISHNEEMVSEGLSLLEQNLNQILTSEFPKFPSEGIQSVTKYLTSIPVLSHISSHIGTKDLIQTIEYPPTDEILSNVLLSILSVIEKTSGKEQLKVFVEDFIVMQLHDQNINEIWGIKNPYGMLSDILKQKGDVFQARILREAGKNTLLSVYVVGLYTADKKLIGTGYGETVDIAQEMAARDALCIIFDTQYPLPTFRFIKERQSKRQECLLKGSLNSITS